VSLAIMPDQRTAAITFWADEPSRVMVFNGFSFVAHAVPLDHFFVNPAAMSDPFLQRSLCDALSGYEKIYCSLTAAYQFQAIRRVADKRWMFGGPAIINSKVSPASNNYKGSMESLLGMPPSTTFTNYWTGHPALPRKPVYFTCSLGNGCYWNKCTFCDYHEYGHEFCKKDDIAKILSQLSHPESTCFVHLCVAACTPAILKEVLATGQQSRFTFVCFCRADAPMVRFAREYQQSFSGLFFSIGVESLSSAAMAILEKGFDFEAVFEMTKAILEKGGTVEWSIMDNLPFLTMDMAAEYEANCARSAELAESYPRLAIYNNGPVVWPNAAAAGQHGPFTSLADGRSPSVISPGTPAYDANRRAGEAVMRSGVTVHGLPLGASLG
jgi:hypothetical protein